MMENHTMTRLFLLFLLLAAGTLPAAVLPFRSGDVLSAELTTAEPKIENFNAADYNFKFVTKSYALVTVKLARGRTLSVHDFSLSLFGQKYPCVAIRSGDGSFDASKEMARDLASSPKYGLLFVVDGGAVGADAIEKINLVANAPGTYPVIKLPFTNLKNRPFSPASQIPDGGNLKIEE